MTAPTGVDCTVWIDGQRLADGQPDEPDTDPFALSGLTINWGRSTTIDQPAPATATLTVLDPPGGDAFLGTLTSGKQFQVRATGTMWEPADDPTMRGPLGGRIRVGPDTTAQPIAELVDVTAAGGRAAQVDIAPAPFTADPAGWDAIPKTAAGQQWTAVVTLTLPPGAVAVVSPIGWTSPAPSAAPEQIEHPGAVVAGDTARTPVPVTLAEIASPAGRWIGLRIRVYPAGWRWVDAPGSWADAPWTWRELGVTSISGVQVYAPAGRQERTVVVFDGRITDLQAAWSRSAGAVELTVTAADWTAELANRDLGDEPWPAEPLAARAARILTAAGVAVPLTVDPRPGALTVSRVDVDRQQVTPMLQALATTADAVLWAATHATTGPYLWIVDPHARRPVLVLTVDPDSGLVVIGAAGGADQTVLDACLLQLDPVQWTQNTDDVATRVAVIWADQSTQPDTTERTYTLTDAAAEDELGTLRVSVTTQLTTEHDAASVAGYMLARLSETGWRVSGLDWDTTNDPMTNPDTLRALDLLDGTTRLGRPLIITGLPDWSPISGSAVAYLEGGRYTYDRGAWILELIASSAHAGGQSVTWATLDPAWRWVDLDPTIRWVDVIGVGASQPPETT